MKTEHHLLIICDDTGQRVVHLQDVAYSLGRDISNAIVLDGQSVSRQHALLIRVPSPIAGYHYRVVDGSSAGKPSANGLYINGKRCASHQLKKGDLIQLGKKVKIAYQTVNMEKIALTEYIESLAYQSLKFDVTNAKRTLVRSNGVAVHNIVEGSSQFPISSSAHLSDRGSKKEEASKKATILLSRKEILKELKKPVSQQMWMVVVAALISLTSLTTWLAINQYNSKLEISNSLKNQEKIYTIA